MNAWCTTHTVIASPTRVNGYLTPTEAARILRREPWSIVAAIKAGRLRAARPTEDGCWLIRPADLDHFVDQSVLSSPVPPASPAPRGSLRERLAYAAAQRDGF